MFPNSTPAHVCNVPLVKGQTAEYSTREYPTYMQLLINKMLSFIQHKSAVNLRLICSINVCILF